ncbi:MAG: ribonucleotide-diphosphate reductase subunit beta [Bdellovibrionales bacterium]|nr:ribonucleotide-diphosphate reductase subunit beta [Bdellovibrionales bacterium]
MILDPGFDLTLRPMKYPVFYEMYKNGIKNTWTVDEIDFSSDLVDLHSKLNDAEKFLIHRLVAFFATGDSIVGNNLVLNLYKHINSPEARLYLSRQLYEEALHVQFYLTLLDNYIPDIKEREKAFAAIHNIPSIAKKGEYSFKWMDSIDKLDRLDSIEDKRRFLMNLICFAGTIEGLFFFAAFAYVYFLRSKGLLNGLASGTNWVFRDESCHIEFAFEVVKTAIKEEPELMDNRMRDMIKVMMEDAIEAEMAFAEDILTNGIAGLSAKDMKTYLQFIADQRLETLNIPKQYNVKNPFPFMELQDSQELTNFFERRVAAYQVGVTGEVAFDESF